MERRFRSDQILLFFVGALSAALLLPALFMDGMFMDGLIYTCVGKNLAAGEGTFWHPSFSSTYMTVYHEQPPLLFGLEALFFKVLGNSLYTERIFCFTMFIVCFFALRMLWRALWPENSEERKMGWLPALLFFTSPVTFYAYTNNVEEATMVVFALFSAAFIFRGLRSRTSVWRWYVLGGIALVASSMCKGFQGLFPLVIPFVWWWCVRDITFRKAFVATAVVVAVPALFYSLISLSDTVRSSYSMYFHDRLYATFNVAGAATTKSRFFILYELFLDLIPAIVAAVFIFLADKKFSFKREALAFFLIGMSGILPLMVTLEQRGFYLVTGLPFITTAIALLSLNGAIKMTKVLDRFRAFRLSVSSLGIIITAGTFFTTVYLAGTPKRDATMLSDVKIIGEHCGEHAVVAADHSTWSTWSLQGYLVRYYSISIADSDTSRNFYIVQEGQTPPEGYSKIVPGTQQYHLYSK